MGLPSQCPRHTYAIWVIPWGTELLNLPPQPGEITEARLPFPCKRPRDRLVIRRRKVKNELAHPVRPRRAVHGHAHKVERVNGVRPLRIEAIPEIRVCDFLNSNRQSPCADKYVLVLKHLLLKRGDRRLNLMKIPGLLVLTTCQGRQKSQNHTSYADSHFCLTPFKKTSPPTWRMTLLSSFSTPNVPSA